MSKQSRWAVILLTLLVVIAVGWLLARRQPRTQAGAVLNTTVPVPITGFAQASEPREFVFPQDHGPHPEFQTEWWYFTGNLVDDSGQRYGYQLTFFRRALAPPQDTPARTSSWAASQVYMAHFAFTNGAAKAFNSFERLERGAAGLTGAEGAGGMHVWLDDWDVQQTAEGRYRLIASQGNLSLDLTLIEKKPPVLQGDAGRSQKGAQAGNASYYYSLTRLETAGTATLGEEKLEVSGLSWMDHEFSTSALSHGQIGWDWFALQLSNGSDLMAFNLRREDGSPDPYSSGSLVDPGGNNTPLTREDFLITPLGTWTSPDSKARYPSGWRLEIPGQDIVLEITPLIPDQENRLTFTYWEGAVLITGKVAGQMVDGTGYVELTGYAASMQGEF